MTAEAESKNDKEYAEAFEQIRELAQAMSALYDNAYQVYSDMVSSVLNDWITEEKDIEHIMDGLLDFCEDERFLKLYKDLCRHVYYHYPKMVGEHVALFRLLFMERGEEIE